MKMDFIIELGSNAFKIMNCSTGEIVYLKPITYKIVGENGGVDLKVFKKSVFNPIKNCKSKGLFYGKVKCYLTGVYIFPATLTVIREIIESQDIQTEFLKPEVEIKYSYWSLIKKSDRDVYIDLGGGTTDMGCFLNGSLSNNLIINIGGNHFLYYAFNKSNYEFGYFINQFEKFIFSYLAVYVDRLSHIFSFSDRIVVTGSPVKSVPKKFLINGNLEINTFINYLKTISNEASIEYSSIFNSEFKNKKRFYSP